MNRIIVAVAVGLFALVVAGCIPTEPPARTFGDSVAYQIGTELNAENNAVGGTTVCDTAFGELPEASKVFLHFGGHSWGQYDATAARACLNHVLDRYSNVPVYLATSPQPMAIFCQWGSYEYDLRLKEFDDYKRSISRPNVRLVELNGIGTGSDCTHLTPQGITEAANRTQDRGF